VAFAGKRFEHPYRISGIFGLSEHLAFNYHGRVGAQNGLAISLRNSACLVLRQPAHVVLGPLAISGRFIHTSYANCEGNPRLA
jgi:hypothetical protein